jgi:hypothetical protein
LTATAADSSASKDWVISNPFSPDVMLFCRDGCHTMRLPLNVGLYLSPESNVFRQSLDKPIYRLRDVFNGGFDAYSKIRNLLTSKSPNFVKGTRISELDLLFGNHGKSLSSGNFRVVLGWLLAVSVWKDNIKALDDHLQRLSNKAMSKPSLQSFRPIPNIRQNVTDLKNAVQRDKDAIEDETRAAFTEFQGILSHQLESLDDVFETLLKETDAIPAKASNEIQLVIGSVTIQVRPMTMSTPIPRLYTLLTPLTGF